MTLTQSIKRLLVECHPDRHGGDHSRMERVYAAMKRPSNAMSAVRRCRVCGVRIGGLKTCQMHMFTRTLLASVCVILFCSCTVTKQPTPQLSMRGDVRTSTAPRMLGCAWDAPTNYNPLVEFFEVWSTTNLTQPFTLRTNTTETVALFPEQQMEFYKVRTAHTNGLKSEWATTGH